MSYGSFELKRSYQRNLGLGIVLSGVGFVLLALWFSFISSLNEPSGERIIRIVTIAELTPPIKVIEDEPIGSPMVEGIPDPVPKAQNMKIQVGKRPYRGEIHGVVPDLNLLSGVAGSCDGGWIEIKSFSNQKVKLVETDSLPKCLHVILPEYPDSARVNEIEADVSFSVLVDPKGRVREVFAKPSRPGWGFAEATANAVGGWRYRPAVSDGEKVAVRVAYKLRFRLEGES